MKSHYLLVLIWLFVQLFYSCRQENNDQSSTIELKTVTLDNSEVQLYAHYQNAVKIDTFIFLKKNTYKHGTVFSEFQPIGNNLLIVDRDVSEISCISKNGTIQWIPTPSSPGIDRYDIIGDVEVDFLNKEIYIEDLMKNVIDVFDFQGNHQRTIRDVPFMDFALLNKNELLLDISDIVDQVGLAQDPPVRNRFRRITSTERVDFSAMPDKIMENQIPVNNHNRFNSFNDLLQHRMPYEDIVYVIEKDLSVTPLLRFSFAQSGGFVEVARNPNVEIVWTELSKENLVEPSLVIYDQNKDRTFINYWQGEGFYFAILEKENQVMNPGEFYQFGEFILKAPTHYNDGVFYQQLFRYEFDFLQKAFVEKMTSEEIKAGLQNLETEKGDDDDIIIFSIEFM